MKKESDVIVSLFISFAYWIIITKKKKELPFVEFERNSINIQEEKDREIKREREKNDLQENRERASIDDVHRFGRHIKK